MIYSKTCEYAIRALVYLANQDKKAYFGASEVSLKTEVPQAYLGKIFQGLVRHGVLRSRRGAGGGVALAVDYKELSLMSIIEAIDDLSFFNQCAMGLDECDSEKACPLHDVWVNAKEEIMTTFTITTLYELTKNSKEFKYGKMSRSRLKSVVC